MTAQRFGPRVIGIPLDVTDPHSVAGAFGEVIAAWGGIDLVIVNAGIAHVAPLVDLDIEAFRRLERVNIEGTLLVLAESSRQFRRQGTGGDVVLVSTKNVFAPGAKFGAYSATKAANKAIIGKLLPPLVRLVQNELSAEPVADCPGLGLGSW